MTKQNGERPAGQGSFGFYGNQSMDDWLMGMGITSDDQPSGHEAIGHAGPGKVCNAPACREAGQCQRVSTAIYPAARDPLRAAQAAQDFHDAYHTQGMKDAAGCLLCFDYDERHGQYDPVTGADQDGPGCRDCGTPPDSTGGNHAHLLDCPAVAR